MKVDQHLPAPLAQLVEQQSPKLLVEGSIPSWRATQALLTQLVEYQTFNLGVAGSSPAWRTTVTDHRRFNLTISFYGYYLVAWWMYHLLSLSLSVGDGLSLTTHTLVAQVGRAPDCYSGGRWFEASLECQSSIN